jgi:hypothetical protein
LASSISWFNPGLLRLAALMTGSEAGGMDVRARRANSILSWAKEKRQPDAVKDLNGLLRQEFKAKNSVWDEFDRDHSGLHTAPAMPRAGGEHGADVREFNAPEEALGRDAYCV